MGQPVNNNDKEGKDVRANWCKEDASDNDNEMAPLLFQMIVTLHQFTIIQNRSAALRCTFLTIVTISTFGC